MLEKRYLGNGNVIALGHGGYVILAVNDRLNFDPGGTAQQCEQPKAVLGKLKNCNVTLGTGLGVQRS